MNKFVSRKAFFTSLTVIGIAVLTLSFYPKNDKLFDLAKNLDIFASLVRELDSYYVDEIDPNHSRGRIR